MRRHLLIPLIITIAGVIGFGWLYYHYLGDTDRLSALGNFIGGAGSLLAIIWLTATVIQNTTQLRLQSESMKEQQREAAHAARHAALATISSTLETFYRNMMHTTDVSLRCVQDIYSRFGQSMENDWPKILEEKDKNRIIDAYTRWLQVEGTTLKFIGLVAHCGRFYSAAVSDSGIKDYADDSEYVAKNISVLAKVPPLVPYISHAGQLAILLIETRRVLDLIRERGAQALVGRPPSASGFSAEAEFRAAAKERASRFNRFLKP